MRTILRSSCASSFVQKKTSSKESSIIPSKTNGDTYLCEEEDDNEEEELAQFYQPLADPTADSQISANVDDVSKKEQNKSRIPSPRKDTKNKRSDPQQPIKGIGPNVTTTAATPFELIEFPHVEPPTDWMNASPMDWNLDTVATYPHQSDTSDTFFPPWTITVGNSTDVLDENVPVDVDTNERWSPEWSFEMSMTEAENPFLTTTHTEKLSKDVLSQAPREENSKRIVSPSPSSDPSKSLTLGLLAQISGLMDYQENTGQYYQGADINYVEPDVSDSELEKAVLATPSFDSHDEKEQKSIGTYTSRGSKSHKSVTQKEVAQDIQFDMNIDDCSWSDILDQSYDSDLPKLLQSYSNASENPHENAKVKSADVTLNPKQHQHQRNLSNGSKDLKIKSKEKETQSSQEVAYALTQKKIENSQRDVKDVESKTPLVAYKLNPSTHVKTDSVPALSVTATTESTTPSNKSSSATFPWKSNLKSLSTNVQSNSSTAATTTVISSPIETSTSMSSSSSQPQSFSQILGKFNDQSIVTKKSSAKLSDGMKSVSLASQTLPTTTLQSSKVAHKSIQQQHKPFATTPSQNQTNSTIIAEKSNEKSVPINIKLMDKSPENTDGIRKPASQTETEEETNKPFNVLLAQYNQPKKRGGFKPGSEMTTLQKPINLSLPSKDDTSSKKDGKIESSTNSDMNVSKRLNTSGRETPLTSHLSSDSHHKSFSRQGNDHEWLIKPADPSSVSKLGNSVNTQGNELGQRPKAYDSDLKVQLKPVQVPHRKAVLDKTPMSTPWMQTKSPQSNELKDKSYQVVEVAIVGDVKTTAAATGHLDSKLAIVRSTAKTVSPIDTANTAPNISSTLMGPTSIGKVHGRYTGKSNVSNESPSAIVTSDTTTEKAIDTLVSEAKTTTLMQTFETELVETQESYTHGPIIRRSSMAPKVASIDSKTDSIKSMISPTYVKSSKTVIGANIPPLKSSTSIARPLKTSSSPFKPLQVDLKPIAVQEPRPTMATKKVSSNQITFSKRALSPGLTPNSSPAVDVAALAAENCASNGTRAATPIDLSVHVDGTSILVTPTSNIFQRNQNLSRSQSPQAIPEKHTQPSWVRLKTPQPNAAQSQPSWTLPKAQSSNSSSTISSKKNSNVPSSKLDEAEKLKEEVEIFSQTAGVSSVSANATVKGLAEVTEPSTILSQDEKLVAPSSIKMHRRDDRVTIEAKKTSSHSWIAKNEALLDDTLKKEGVAKPSFAISRNSPDNIHPKERLAPTQNQTLHPPSSNPVVKLKNSSLTTSDQSLFSPSAIPAIRVKRTTSVTESLSLSGTPSSKTKVCPEPSSSSSERGPTPSKLTSMIAVFEQERNKSVAKNASARRVKNM